MSIAAEKTSWRWQLEQFQQQVSEWIEVKLRTNDRDLKLDIFPSWLAPLLVKLMWLLLAAAIAWFGYYVVYPYCREWWANRQRKPMDRDLSTARHTLDEMLAKSQQYQRDGDYTQASRWLYLALLERLNDAKLIPHRSSRTDREYLNLLTNLPQIDIGEILLSMHEQVHFGDRQIDRSGFDRCQQAYQQIDRELQTVIRNS